MQQSQAADKHGMRFSIIAIVLHSWVLAACCVRNISRLNILHMVLHAYINNNNNASGPPPNPVTP
jgi:hypothetical protein